ncbi:hypothetical protein D1871_11165 [Nakamurella silvestris]|nr:hypothetical protein D1871_11165 [Nakamurella silvestris]
MEVFDAIDTKSAQFAEGPLSARPPYGRGGLFYLVTDGPARRLWYDTGGQWLDLTPIGGTDPSVVTVGGTGAEGTSQRAARADHTHSIPTLTAADIPAIPASKINTTLPINRGGTGNTTAPDDDYMVGGGGGAFLYFSPSQVLTKIGAVGTSRTITAGTGLQGGGDLTTNRSFSVLFGAAAGTVAQGNDSRLSDARVPKGAAGGVLSGTYPDPGFAPALFDPAANVAGMRTLGAGATQAAPGNDSRFTDSRRPNGAAGGDLEGSYPSPTIRADLRDPAAGTAGLRTLGTNGQQAAAGNDARFSDPRVPKGSAGGVLAGTYPNPALNPALNDPIAEVAGLRTLGSGPLQAAPGDHTHPPGPWLDITPNTAGGWSHGTIKAQTRLNGGKLEYVGILKKTAPAIGITVTPCGTVAEAHRLPAGTLPPFMGVVMRNLDAGTNQSGQALVTPVTGVIQVGASAGGTASPDAVHFTLCSHLAAL